MAEMLRDGRRVVVEDGFGGVDLLVLPRVGVDAWPSGTLDRPYTERCEACGGCGRPTAWRLMPGTTAWREAQAEGPCGACWGIGRVLFVWTEEAPLRVVCLPPALGTPYIAEAWRAGHDLR